MSNTAAAAATGSSKPPVVKPPVVQPGTGNNIIVNPCQRGNPILECVKNVGKEFGDIVVDYQVGRTTGVLFLSLRYHRLHPEYIHQRIERLGHAYNLRILLLMCDVTEHQEPIRELTKICLVNNITIMVAWTPEEAGFYLTTYKQFEHKPPDLIKERVDKDYPTVLRNALTSISKVNKTDVETLRTSLGSVAAIARASSDRLQNLPGFGQVKVKRIKDAFEKPFRNNTTSALPFESQQRARQQPSQPSPSLDSGPSSFSRRAPPLNPNRRTTIGDDDDDDLYLPHPPRAQSPAWDIELDLNDSPPQSPAPQPPRAGPSEKRRRASSVEWDIEKDPDESGAGANGDNPRKRQVLEEDFGEPAVLIEL
ncbi:DNA repair protein rad10 [Cristinia sonorae]|uniref:DNA repair protein rad10 n=1 Tax=Cristinia sonorae TaxID=1940300 RepID=A0A8K0UGD2_9AGAR|nr:DNA repair protein rad10 [Cristinia sonorae]